MSRKAGTISEETKTRLLQAATEEFAEYGYERSSLRRICKNAEVTTGALYFFFQDKEDLFQSVIAPVTEPILQMMESHYEKERECNWKELGDARGEEEDIRASFAILDICYGNKKVTDIILSSRNLPVVTAFFDRMIEIMDMQTVHLLKLADENSISVQNKYVIHWFSHLQIDAMLNVISHGLGEEEAKEQLKIAIRFLRGGFQTFTESGQ